jgi:NADH-quinone oxidoreductase subunit N
VIASLISYFYYLRVVVVMYMRPAAADEPQESLVASGPLRFTVAFAAIGVLLLFFFPMQFLQAAQQSVATLFAAPGAFFGLVP